MDSSSILLSKLKFSQITIYKMMPYLYKNCKKAPFLLNNFNILLGWCA